MKFADLKPGQVISREGLCADVVYIDEGKQVALLLMNGRIFTISAVEFENENAHYIEERGPDNAAKRNRRFLTPKGALRG